MKYVELVRQKDYFQEISWRHFSNCVKAYENKEYLSVSVWAAVFAESILKDILYVMTGENLINEELDPLIKRLQNILKNNGSKIELSMTDITAAKDIIRRANEIREKRNRLVHDTGIDNDDLDSDAEDIYKNINKIVERYLKTVISTIVKANNERMRENSGHDIKKAEPDFPMFLSTNTPHTIEQTEFIEDFSNKLRDIGIDPVRCKFEDFDRKDPLSVVRDTICECEGVIVLGLERSHAYFYRDKEGSDKESEAIHRKYSSSWMHLEAGIGYGLGKELFVVCQNDICSDGIFDRDWCTFPPLELNMPLSVDDPKMDTLLRALDRFRKKTLKNKEKE